MTKRNSYLLKRFGITDEQYEELLRKQEFRCGACRRHHLEFPRKLCVDHEHQKNGSGPIRGLLCNWCNRYVIGRHKGKAGAELLLAASKYLEGPYPGWIVPAKVKKKRKRKNGKKLRI